MQNKYIKIVLILCVSLSLVGCTNGKIKRYRDDAIEQFNLGNYNEALNLFDSSLDIGKGRIGDIQYDILLYKAECLIKLNRPHEARDIYEILLMIDKKNKDYKALYNKINNSLYLLDFKLALDEDRVDDAVNIYEKIKEAGLDQEQSVIFNRAVLYEKQGDWKNAYNAFSIYQKSYPDDEDCKRELEFIDNQSKEYIEPTTEKPKETKEDKDTKQNSKKKKK